MAKRFLHVFPTVSKLASGSAVKLLAPAKLTGSLMNQNLYGGLSTLSRTHSTLSHRHGNRSQLCQCLACTQKLSVCYSTEVEKEISKFLEKEIQYEKTRSSDKLPKIAGFDVKTDGGDVTFTKTSNGEKIVVQLSVNGAVDSVLSEDGQNSQDEPPQMVCKPNFDIEITKGDTVLAFQCSFPSHDHDNIEEGQYGKDGQDSEQFDDQFEIEEVAIHGGEWKDTTYSVSTANMDAELFDLLMDLLDEKGINDEFIAHLIDFCTAYENKQYVSFLGSLKSFAEK